MVAATTLHLCLVLCKAIALAQNHSCIICPEIELQVFPHMQFGLGFVPHEALLVPPQVNYFDETAFEVVAKLQEVEEL